MKIVENRKKFFAASLIVIIIGFAAMIFNAQAGRGAFQYDVEFTGGTSFDLDLGQDYEQEDLQKLITDVTGQDSPQIQQVIGTNEVTVKIQSIDSATRETLTNAILEVSPSPNHKMNSGAMEIFGEICMMRSNGISRCSKSLFFASK